MAPSFLHTLTAFWLDFEGLGPSGGFKKQEKTAPGKSCFFGLKRKVPKSAFYDFRASLGVHFGVLGRPKMVQLIFKFFVGVWRPPPRTILGPLLAPFYVVFGLTFEVFWRFFGDVSESWFEVVFFETCLGFIWFALFF